MDMVKSFGTRFVTKSISNQTAPFSGGLRTARCMLRCEEENEYFAQ